jgi:hypothetical protein
LEDDILALKLDGMNKYAIFINEGRSDLNTLSKIDSHLNRKYLSAIEVTERDTTMEIWDVIAYLTILVMLATLAVVILAT